MRIYMRRWDVVTGSVIILQARKISEERIEIIPGSAVVIDEDDSVDYQPHFDGFCWENNYVIVEEYTIKKNPLNWDILWIKELTNLYYRLDLV